MSLIKQLWLAVIISMVLAFGGNFIVSTISGKHYLEQQLQMKNIDNAASLALALSQIKKDPVTVDLLLSAQFDTGHYQYIGLVGPGGAVITERRSTAMMGSAPLWFTRLIPIHAHAGVAQVQNGWEQYGTLKVESHEGFAYQELWHGALLMLLWSLALIVISGYLGTLALHAIMRPLNAIVNQAEAIGDRRFISIAEPKTIEFKALVTAMNRLSNRIKKMLGEEGLRLEQLRLEANYDAVSGLMNRNYFFSRVDALIANEESFSEGVLVLAHVSDLTAIDQALGHSETDALLKRLGDALKGLNEAMPSLMAGRVTGSDFAIFSSQAADSFALSSQIKGILLKAAALQQNLPNLSLSIVAKKVNQGQVNTGPVEALVKLMLNVMISVSAESTNATNSNNSADMLHVIGHDDMARHENRDESEWRTLLTSALAAKRLKLAFYPVVNRQGQLIHHESPVRLQLKPDDAWLPASEFISWAIRLDLMTRIDNLVAEAALQTLAGNSDSIGLNVSVRAICNPDFLKRLTKLIRDNPGCAERLWLEVPEQGAFEHLAEFRSFCAAVKPLGCKIGIEHAGALVSRMGELHDIGLDYIKIDVSVIRSIDSNIGNQAFLRGLCLIAHSIGLMAIAEGVQTQGEIACLPGLGIDAMTGPGIQAG